jgi:hypothetical protein
MTGQEKREPKKTPHPWFEGHAKKEGERLKFGCGLVAEGV